MLVCVCVCAERDDDLYLGSNDDVCPNQAQQQKTKRLRTSFKHHQLRMLKSYFATNHNPDAKDLKQLSQKTTLSKRVLQVTSSTFANNWQVRISALVDYYIIAVCYGLALLFPTLTRLVVKKKKEKMTGTCFCRTMGGGGGVVCERLGADRYLK